MTNVLPEDAKRDIRRFYRGRLVTVGSLVMLSCACICLLALVPAYLVVRLPDAAGVAQVGEPPAVGAGDQADIRRAQLLLKDLSPLATTTISGLDAMRSALSVRTPGVVVSGLEYDHGTIVVQGSGPSRDAINAYALALRNNPAFKLVSVPLSALTASGESTFSIAISGTF